MWHIVLSQNANPPLTKGKVTIGATTFSIELATTTMEKVRGLSYGDRFGGGDRHAFYIYSRGLNFWMKDMNFPIDIIWIAGGKVAGFAEMPRPSREPAYGSCHLHFAGRRGQGA